MNELQAQRPTDDEDVTALGGLFFCLVGRGWEHSAEQHSRKVHWDAMVLVAMPVAVGCVHQNHLHKNHRI